MDITLEVKGHMSKHAITYAKSIMKGDPHRPPVPIIYKSYFTDKSNVGFLNVIHTSEIIKQNYSGALGSR
jgi:hypothetical protein